MTDATREELERRLGEEGLTILDVRSRGEFTGVLGAACDPRQGRLPGAVHLDLQELMRLTAPHVLLDAGWVGSTEARQRNPPASDREWSFWPASTWIPGPGCYGIQLDTPQRSSAIIFEAL